LYLCVQNQVAFSLGTSGGAGTRGVPPPPGRADARARRLREMRVERGKRMVVVGFLVVGCVIERKMGGERGRWTFVRKNCDGY
jgi:hypothetical protein